MMFKSERREKKKKRRKFVVHGRRLAEIIRNAIAKRSARSESSQSK